MKTSIVKMTLGAIVLSGLAASSAVAMPALNGAAAVPQGASVEKARWVCGPFGCQWRPNYWGGYGRPYGYYRPRPYWGRPAYWGGYGGGWRRHYW